MRGTQMALVVILALAASPALAASARSGDKKQSQGGESSRDVGARHTPGPSGGTAVPRSPGSAPSGPSLAEQRHPRAGTGTGDHYRGGYTYSGGRGYRPYGGYYGDYYGGYYGRYYGPYYGLYARHYSPYYGWGYWGPYYGRGYYYYDGDDRGALRLIGKPRDTRVFVDGYYAGVIDDFDGLFQRLRLPPGRHEITLQLEGYRTQRLRLYVRPDQTTKIHVNLVPGEGEDAPLQFGGTAPPDWDRKPVSDRWDDRAPREPEAGAAPAPPRPPAAAPGSATLELRVAPDDASVYVDGEFRGTGRDAASLAVAPGTHRIEIVRPGFRTFDREVDVEEGQATRLDAALERL